MSDIAAIAIVVALLSGLAIGWFLAGRGVAQVRAERDERTQEFKQAIADLARAQEQAAEVPELRERMEAIRTERDEALRKVTKLETQASNFDERIAEFNNAREAMTGQFREVANKLLGEAQNSFLSRASDRFTEEGKTHEAKLKALLQPVQDTLKRYEENVSKVEGQRKEAYGNLTGLIETMRQGQESVRTEAAKLSNALRAAPKARGRWGEQQLRNVLETCGLAEHTDFATEVSVEGESGRLRPDAMIRIPGGRSLVVDAKVSLNAYQDAHGAVDETERAGFLAQHVASMKNHINALGAKSYQNQFDDTPDYVIMFVPGEHFLSAALEHDPQMWDYAFDRRVLIATPTNLIAIARTVAAVWRQEKLAGEAREIAELGKELHGRLWTMSSHVAKLGKNLETAMGAYNSFVGSMESQVLTSARRFESLNIETGDKAIDALPMVEQSPRPLTKLATGEAGDTEEAAE